MDNRIAFARNDAPCPRNVASHYLNGAGMAQRQDAASFRIRRAQ